MTNKDPCRGCVCFTCSKSAVNGAVYSCPEKKCARCEAQNTKFKLAYCATYTEPEEREDFRL